MAELIAKARRLARELAHVGNSGVIPCSEGYGPVWKKHAQLDAVLNKIAAGVPGTYKDVTEGGE